MKVDKSFVKTTQRLCRAFLSLGFLHTLTDTILKMNERRKPSIAQSVKDY